MKISDLKNLLDNFDDDTMVYFYDLNNNYVDVCPDSSFDDFNLHFVVNAVNTDSVVMD